MGAELYRIAAHEDAELDTSRLLVLRQSLGDERCREVVEEVVFHLTDRLGQLQTALDADNAAEAQVLADAAGEPQRAGRPRRLRPGRARPRRLPRRRRRDRHRGGGRAADAARRGFAVLGHGLRRPIGLVARAGAAAKIAATPRSKVPHAPRPRARRPGGPAAGDRARRSSTAGSERAGRGDARLGAGRGLRGRRSARCCACRRRTARSPRALVGWGAPERGARDRFRAGRRRGEAAGRRPMRWRRRGRARRRRSRRSAG